ncbi:RnfH family protein [Ideonella sp.]|uniref:RnfH family protein n=1 Tax=Ideonella sp. TaxID=1929293 RepID=UPI002B485307|nr:RnfH family protein [Ideonella sp.]HJV70186.1 RnfH family protein [Ideonella sp.]
MDSDSAAALGPLSVQVSYSPAPREVDSVALKMPAGSTVADALRASGLLERHGLALDAGLSVGVWMKAKPLDTPLREADRVEIYRGLKVDPKEARRLRYRKQPKSR